MKKLISVLLIISSVTLSLAGCRAGTGNAEKSEVEKIIEEAEKMSLEELYKKAIEESKGRRCTASATRAAAQPPLPALSRS